MKGGPMKKHNNSKMREGKNSRKNEKARKNSRKRGDDMIKNSVSKRKQVIKKISVGILSTALVSSNALGTLSLANVSELVATDEKVIDLAQKMLWHKKKL